MQVNFSPRRWESWALLFSVALSIAMTVELVPATGIWHKVALLASGLFALVLGTAGRPAVTGNSEPVLK